MSENNGLAKYHHFPRDFDKETYRRALTLIEECGGNCARAHRALKAELKAEDRRVPSYDTVWAWANKSGEMLAEVRADRREEIIAVSGEVALAFANALMESSYEEMSPYQLAIIYGIAMDKRTGWENTRLKPAATMNVQFNLVTRD